MHGSFPIRIRISVIAIGIVVVIVVRVRRVVIIETSECFWILASFFGCLHTYFAQALNQLW